MEQSPRQPPDRAGRVVHSHTIARRALVLGWAPGAIIGFAVWLADFAWRLLRQRGLAALS